MAKENVLFVCIHNSARSQMAEEILRKLAGERFEVESAGLEPGTLNPVVVDILKEEGIDISGKKTQSVFELNKQGKRFQYVITVCDESQSERCPVFPSTKERIHWSFPDPSTLSGDEWERKQKTKDIRNQIEDRIKRWLQELPQS